MEMASGIVDSLLSGLKKGILTYDPIKREEVLVVGGVFCFEGDNPMQAEAASIIGGNGTHACRSCMVSSAIKSSEDLARYLNLGDPRSWQRSVDLIKTLIDKTETQSFGQIKKLYSESGVKDTICSIFVEKLFAKPEGGRTGEIADIKSNLPDKYYNPLIRLEEYNGFRDTPVEVLHTVLLGTAKWLLRSTFGEMSPLMKHNVTLRLDGVSFIKIPIKITGKYLIQHYRSFVGKEIKAITQLAPFIFIGILPHHWVKAWQLMAEMTAMIYQV